MNVLCDQEYGSGGWTVIQYRFDGSVNFYRGWQEYKNGFGSLEGEFWLGLDRIFQLTASKPLELVILVVDVNGVSTFAKYDRFEIGEGNQGYVLKSVGVYSGTAGDELTDLVGQKFTTQDFGNHEIFEICAYTGGWWHKDCFMSNLNGQYVGEHKITLLLGAITTGMVWKQPDALKFSKMMVRPKQ